MIATHQSSATRNLVKCLAKAACFLMVGSILHQEATAQSTISSARNEASGTIRRVSVRHDPQRVDANAAPVGEIAPRSVSRKQPTLRKPVASVQQVGFMEDYGTPAYPQNSCSSCGPVCDCHPSGVGAMLAEPLCGAEEVTCGVEGWAGPACGCEGPCTGYCDSGHCDIDHFRLPIPFLRIDWTRFSFFAGTQAFKGPTNFPVNASTGTRREGSGSFGFHQGFNEGRDLRPLIGWDLSAQLGLRATQSNLQGDEFSAENRNQIFVTGGLFRRVDYGLQYGAVVDYLSDDWYYHADLVQIRGELSWRATACHEIGFRFAGGTNDDLVTTTVTGPTGNVQVSSLLLEAADQYRGFYRRSFGNEGTWTAFIGGTNQEHLILGSELDIPLQKCWSASFGSTYFSPGDDSLIPERRSEGWNLSIGMVFRPGMGHPRNRYSNPMFSVADNGSFFAFGR